MHSPFRIPGLRGELAKVSPVVTKGRVTEISGPVIRAALSGAAIGDFVEIQRRRTTGSPCALLAQVVGFNTNGCVLSPFATPTDIVPGAMITLLQNPPQAPLGDFLLGTVLNGFGEIIAGPNQAPSTARVNDSSSHSRHALNRVVIKRSITTGIRAIDALLTIGFGQRLGIFAEPGVGKSTLMGALARNSSATVNVIALIGERGREVNELLTETLDSETRERSVIIVSTSDDAPALRTHAAHVAMLVAEYFRDRGEDVLFQLDSLTRYMRAVREIGLAAGELPVRQGYPPSVFSVLPQFIERAGAWSIGSITALYTILSSADVANDPLVEEVQGLVDGHLVLSAQLAERGHYPAIDVLRSLSRLQPRLQDEEAVSASKLVRSALSLIERDGELATLSDQVDANLARALELEPEIISFLQQPLREYSSPSQTTQSLRSLATSLNQMPVARAS